MPSPSPLPGSPQFLPLREAPRLAFEAERWQAFVDRCGGESSAIAFIGLPNALRYMRSQAARDTEEKELNAESEALLQIFVDALVSGELEAIGVFKTSAGLISIDPEICRSLQFDFAGNNASNADYAFSGIRVRSVRNVRDPKDTLIENCTAWLIERDRKQGYTVKKKLYDEAKQQFPAGLTKRMFDVAYQRVFEKTVGRPVKSK